MATLTFFAAIVLALVALNAAEGDNTLQLQCQRQLQESSLDACRQVVDHQLAVQLPFFAPHSSPMRPSQWSTGVRAQCCRQLQDISPECRAAAIRQIVRQYEHQAVVPLRKDPYYPGEDEDQQGGSYYPGEDKDRQGGSYYPGGDEGQQGGSYYPGETYPQQEQWWEHQQQQGQGYFPYQQVPWSKQQEGQGYQDFPQQQQQGEGSFGELTTQQQQGQWSKQQEGQGSQDFPQQQQQGEGSFGELTTQQQQGQGQYGGRQSQQQEGFGELTTQQQQGQGQYGSMQQEGSFRPSPTISQQQQGSYCPSQTFPQQNRAQQQEGQGQHCGKQSQQQTGFGGFSSPPQFGTEQQTAQLRLIARARQVAAQLPLMCRLEGRAFSARQY